MKLEVSVAKDYGRFQLSADFALDGRRFGVFGPSGSGKSTLVRMVAGLEPPDSGTIRLDGQILFDHRKRINVPPEKRRIAVVFQHAHLFPHMSVQRNLFYGWRRANAVERKIDPDALIEVLHLGHLLKRGVATLSGGERQRVALGRAVLSTPRLVLMDEPLTGLDEKLKYQIMPYLQRLFSEFDMPLLLISHSLNEIRLMTDEVLVFEHGRIIDQMHAEKLARSRLGSSRVGYINLLTLHGPRPHDDLWKYRWNGMELVLTEPEAPGENLFELSSKDITLFKRHPEASSARNMLQCTVAEVFESGNRVGVELACHGEKLITEIVHDAARELDVRPGAELVAVIKASAFRRLF